MQELILEILEESDLKKVTVDRYKYICISTYVWVAHIYVSAIQNFLRTKLMICSERTKHSLGAGPFLSSRCQRAWSWWMVCMTMWRHLGLDLPTSRGPASQADAYQVFFPLPFIMLPLLPITVGVFPRALVQSRWNVLNMVASALSRCDNSILLSISWFKKLWGCLGRWLGQ